MPVVETTYGGVPALTMTRGDYQAILLPEKGGNLVSFRDTAKNYRFIREPLEDMERFERSPIRFGIPILFPPNRYEDGRFTAAGQSYELPVNEESTHNHIHGFLYRAEWPVVGQGEDGRETFVEIRQDIDQSHPMYAHWPHAFSISVLYALSEDGLRQQVRIVNHSDRPMPCMLGFHTALNVPFAEGSDKDDYVFTATIGERWELSDRKLPTGRFQPLNEGEQRIAHGGISPFFEPMDNHYTARPVEGHNRMVLTDRRLGVKLVYDVGLRYRHWMIWNDGAGGEFFCPEPQTNMVNAPNTGLPDDVSGFVLLAPSETWEEECRLLSLIHI